VSEISHILPDPEASTSTLITPSPNVSTMRIFLQNNFADWRIAQDSQEKSILKGFSVVGGLWAFFGGIFVSLFGKSIMQMLSGAFHFLMNAFIVKDRPEFSFTKQVLNQSLYLAR
jgi:hypothetical protein